VIERRRDSVIARLESICYPALVPLAASEAGIQRFLGASVLLPRPRSGIADAVQDLVTRPVSPIPSVDCHLDRNAW
jgi:hypothetical protein